MGWFIAFLFILVIGCIVVYKTAEVKELHKMRAAFDVKEHDIQKLIEDRKDDPKFNLDYYNGEIEELEEMKALIEKRIEELKTFDI